MEHVFPLVELPEQVSCDGSPNWLRRSLLQDPVVDSHYISLLVPKRTAAHACMSLAVVSYHFEGGLCLNIVGKSFPFLNLKLGNSIEILEGVVGWLVGANIPCQFQSFLLQMVTQG